MADWVCSGTGECRECGEKIEWWKTDKGANMPVNPRPNEPFYGEGDERPAGEIFGRNHFDTCTARGGSGHAPAKDQGSDQATPPAAAAQPGKPEVPVIVRLLTALSLYVIGKREVTGIRISEKGAPHISEGERKMIRNVAKIPVEEDFSIEQGFFKIDPDWRETPPDDIPF